MGPGTHPLWIRRDSCVHVPVCVCVVVIIFCDSLEYISLAFFFCICLGVIPPPFSLTFPGTLDVSVRGRTVSRDTLGEEIVAVEQGWEEWMVRGLSLEDDPPGLFRGKPTSFPGLGEAPSSESPTASLWLLHLGV